MKYMAMLGLLMIALTGDAYAEKMYVTNIIKVTLRTGAGIDHKVIQMLQTGNEVEVLELGGDWSRVRATTGKEGWILSRFLSPEMPSDLMLDALQGKYDKLLARTSVLEAENVKYIEENKRLVSELDQITASLNKISNGYETLKQESSDFLSLKSKYEEATLNLEKQTRRATELNELLLQRNIKIGLLGAGVLFFGFLIGFSTKKQRKRSSLL
ncbi:MAG: TIGR04211 family SH3 domain-containing protein [Pseudomonadota bacterium]